MVPSYIPRHRMRGNGLKLCLGRFRLKKTFLHRKDYQILEQIAWGSDGLTIPGGVQKMYRGGT